MVIQKTYHTAEPLTETATVDEVEKAIGKTTNNFTNGVEAHNLIREILRTEQVRSRKE